MHTLQQIAYTVLFGRPLVFYLGILTYTLVLATALVAFLRTRVKRMRKMPVALHRSLGSAALVLGTLHGLFSLSAYL
jgi:uncharacterized membrane protein